MNDEVINIISGEIHSNPFLRQLENDARNSIIKSNNSFDESKAKLKLIEAYIKSNNLNKDILNNGKDCIRVSEIPGKIKGEIKKRGGRLEHDNISINMNRYLDIPDFINKYKMYDVNNPKIAFKDTRSDIFLYSDLYCDVNVFVDGAKIETSSNGEFPGSITFFIRNNSDNGFRVNQKSEIEFQFIFRNQLNNDNETNIIDIQNVKYWVNIKDIRKESNLPQKNNNNYSTICNKVNIRLVTFDDIKENPTLQNTYKIEPNVLALPLTNIEHIDIFVNLDNPNIVKYFIESEKKKEDSTESLKGDIYIGVGLEYAKIFDNYQKNEDKNDIYNEDKNRSISYSEIVKKNSIDEIAYLHFHNLQENIMKIYRNYFEK